MITMFFIKLIINLLASSSFKKWLNTATISELSKSYETLRQDWLKNGGGDRTPEMRIIDAKITEVLNKEYERTHPNAKLRHREHGWYLTNDD